MADKKRIVVKVGTSTLTNDEGKINLRLFDKLTRVLTDLHNMGNDVVLVSSGAIAVGKNKMNLTGNVDAVKIKQAAAAVGQCSIMFLYDKFFNEYDQTIAQILLTADDIEDEHKKENLINTFNTLLELGIIPIVNENDSVSYAEIESKERVFGDNDMLSAIVSVLCNADNLVIMSDIDGLYDSDPHSNPDAKRIPVVEVIDDEIMKLAGGTGTERGRGGMKTKLQAAKLATENGIDMSIVNGQEPAALYDIVEGNDIGTLFRGNK